MEFLVMTPGIVDQAGSISGIEKKVEELEKLHAGSKIPNIMDHCHTSGLFP
jgi:hypothetical protein